MSSQKISRLPFVAEQGTSKNYWAPAEESGDWSTDNWVGRGYADALVSACGDGELGMVLGFVGEAIVRFGHYGGIEVGFFNRLGEIAACAITVSHQDYDLLKAA